MGNGHAIAHHRAVVLHACSEDYQDDLPASLRPCKSRQGSHTRVHSKVRSKSRRFGRWSVEKITRRKPKTTGRKIKYTKDFATLYRLGSDVTQETKAGVRLRYAVRASDDLKVVLKIFHKGMDGSSVFVSSDDEAEWRKSIELSLSLPIHPGIATTYGVYEDGHAYYVVMECVEGLDLCDLLQEENLSPQDVKEVLRQLLGALSVIHGKNLMHRDLKLENVMVQRHCDSNAIQVKLIDFDTLESWSPGNVTAMDVLGSDQYIAPESYAGRYSPRSDMFAVGVIAYRLLVGAFPFAESIFDDAPGENVVGSPAMDAIRTKLCQASICWDHSAFHTEPIARELWEPALSVREELRPTAIEALADPWFARRSLVADVNWTASAPIVEPTISWPNSTPASVKSKHKSKARSPSARSTLSRKNTSASSTGEANLDLMMRTSSSSSLWEYTAPSVEIPMPPGCMNID